MSKPTKAPKKLDVYYDNGIWRGPDADKLKLTPGEAYFAKLDQPDEPPKKIIPPPDPR